MRTYTYAHGGDVYDDRGAHRCGVTDFSSNINPLGIPPAALDAAHSALARSHMYPDSSSRALLRAISEYEGVPSDWIFCGGGASDIIFRLCHAVKPKRILVTAPSFSDYERAGRAAGADILYYALPQDKNFNLDCGVADLIDNESPEIVFICNPNNPTGSLTEPRVMEQILAACRRRASLLLVDECFLDFVENSGEYTSKRYLSGYKNLIVLKAFTKTFAIPGLRLGYSICSDPSVCGVLKNHGPDWPVSNIAQAAGIAALSDCGEYLKKTVESVASERRFLIDGLQNMGVKAYPSHANFFLFELERKRFSRLSERGILIRDCSNYRGLGEGFYRTAVLAREQNEKLLRFI